MTDIILIGAGGHAKAIVEAIRARGDRLAAYVDPNPATWLDVERIEGDGEVEDGATVAIGIGGTAPDALERRLALFKSYSQRGCALPPVIHPAAHVSKHATIGPGAIVLAGAIVQPDARVGRGAIVNTGATLEHDSSLGSGAHLAPGAIVLGGCRIGTCAMVGAGAVVLPGSHVPDKGLIAAASRYQGTK